MEPALDAPRVASLVCPLCRSALASGEACLRCPRCDRTFESHAGIPDLRIFPDSYLSYEEDRARTACVLDALDRLPLPELLKYYWSLSDLKQSTLRDQFIRGALCAEDKARRVLQLVEKGPSRRALEIGSGTGGFLAVAAPWFEEVVGVDIAMRWLHLSRRRFRDRGVATPLLVCCCAEGLPFPAASFDLIVLTATLEFTREPGRVLAEAARMLRPGGSVFLNTVNRFSLAMEPHVNLWGVGFLPRAWQDRYVRWRRDVGFANIRPLSYRELTRIASRHFAHCQVSPADVSDGVLETLTRAQRAQVLLYRRLSRLPLATALLRWFGPEWDVVLRKAA